MCPPSGEAAFARSLAYGALKELLRDHPPEGSGDPIELELPRRLPRWLEAAGLGTPALLDALQELRAAMEKRSPQDLEESRRALFGHTFSLDCPVHECHYEPSHLFAEVQTLADIAGFYRAFGFEMAPTAGGRADHICAELEFMQLLTWKEARALQEGYAEAAQTCREAQKKFLEAHLGRWGGQLGERLARKAEDDVYRKVGEALREFLELECTRFAPSEGAAAVRP